VGKQEKEEGRKKESGYYPLKRAQSFAHCTHITGSIRDVGMHVFEHKMRDFALKILNMATQMDLKKSQESAYDVSVSGAAILLKEIL
jgi:hypothetical protein